MVRRYTPERIFGYRRDAIAQRFCGMNDFDIEVFYDGGCPLCRREVAWLRRRDRRKRIRFVDITDSRFVAKDAGVPLDALMDRIHARLPDGAIIEGVEVFRRLYAAVGFPFLSRLSRLPGISRLLDLGYSWFARNRLRLTGRCEGATCGIHSRPVSSGTETGTGGPPAVISFGDGALRWFDIGDPIMGGVSSSGIEIDDGIGVFRGVVSLERGGGFASIRSQESRFDLSGFSGILLRTRGDGKRYGLRLRISSNFDGVNFQADFQPQAGVWSDVRLPFPEFRPVFRGRPVPEYPPLDPADIRTFGFIIAGRQEGPFRLELRSIGAYRDPSP